VIAVALMKSFETVKSLAGRHLRPDQYYAIREKYFALRTRLSPVMRALYGSFDSGALREHLAQRIGHHFEILMVHSSLNRMKPMYKGTPLEFVQMLSDFCGPNRTLAMPAFYFGYRRSGKPSPTFEKNPSFDLRRTPSQMGLATEIFRRMKGVRQSRHPMCRVSAFGPLAERLSEGHERAERPCGPGSPFDFMNLHDTMIVGIGKPSVEALSQAHHVEDLMGEDFPVPRSVLPDLTMTLIDGEEEIPFTLRRTQFIWKRNMGKLRDIMGPDLLREWKFHHVPLFATRARDVTNALKNAAGQGITLYEQRWPAGG